jgi:transcriptional regulator with XRE-family HTH domain
MEIDRLKRQLGLRFKELRLSKDMKQEDLERMGIFYLYYGKIERGLVNLTLEKVAFLMNNRDLQGWFRTKYRKRAANHHFASNLARRSSINPAFWRVILTFSSTYFPDPMNHNNLSTTAGTSLLILPIRTIALYTT